MTRENKDKFILSAIFIEGEVQHQLSEVLENKEFMKVYGMACMQYQFCIDEINKTECFLVVDMTERPIYWLDHLSGVLPPSVAAFAFPK